ncbi:restriction endonuclease subunit S [Streptococcus suis]|nr:restriction endonuclease subunit S [Streptococcus suis]
MPNKDRNIPKRRFKAFENADAWELRKLGEVADVFDGTHQTPRYTNQGVMFLSVEDINTLESEKYISSEDFEKEFKIFPEFNDVLMTRIGDIGTSNIVKTNDKIAYYVSLALIKPKKLESHFLNSIIQSKDFQNELWKRTLHIAFPKKINKGEISEVNLKFPTLPEQKTIGTFFSTLDRQITLHQRKLDKLKHVKQAYLSEMFPAEGERMPKRRFPGFTDAWELRKLKLLFIFKYGDGNNNPSNGGPYPVFGAGGVQGGYTEYNSENSIIIGHMGDAGCVSWGEGKHFVTYNGTITRPKEEVFTAKFGYYLLSKMNLRQYRGGSGLPFLTYDMLNDMDTIVPTTKSECDKISEFFSTLDQQITLHQRKLEKLKNLKKALLNELFV